MKFVQTVMNTIYGVIIMGESVKELRLKNGIVRLHLPERTEEERRKYLERLKKETGDFLAGAEMEQMKKKERCPEI